MFVYESYARLFANPCVSLPVRNAIRYTETTMGFSHSVPATKKKSIVTNYENGQEPQSELQELRMHGVFTRYLCLAWFDSALRAGKNIFSIGTNYKCYQEPQSVLREFKKHSVCGGLW